MKSRWRWSANWRGALLSSFAMRAHNRGVRSTEGFAGNLRLGVPGRRSRNCSTASCWNGCANCGGAAVRLRSRAAGTEGAVDASQREGYCRSRRIMSVTTAWCRRYSRTCAYVADGRAARFAMTLPRRRAIIINQTVRPPLLAESKRRGRRIRFWRISRVDGRGCGEEREDRWLTSRRRVFYLPLEHSTSRPERAYPHRGESMAMADTWAPEVESTGPTCSRTSPCHDRGKQLPWSHMDRGSRADGAGRTACCWRGGNLWVCL